MNPGSAAEPGTQFADEPVVMRRLTRSEYDHSVRDILNIDLGLAYNFPGEEVVRGFTNNAFALTFPPLLAEKALAASKQIAARVGNNLSQYVPCAAVAPDAACAQQFIDSFGKSVLRRPVTAEESAGLAAVFQTGNKRSFARGVELVVEALFISAPFFYRVEFGDGVEIAGKPGLARPTSFEMASRLSYLAWNSTPDPQLLALATADALKSPEQVNSEFERLLSDPRARESVALFHGQWLEFSRTDSLNKDPSAFPTWKIEMRDAFRKELELFVDHAAWESSRGFEDLFTSNSDFANAELARFYGVSGPAGAAFEPVTLDASTRSGLFSRAGFLAFEGFDRTSPVRRAAFIRRQLLCQDPPPPPKDVPLLANDVSGASTVRERVTAHTNAPGCAPCHQLLDPLGFGLERYDAIGQYRETENGVTVDDTGAAYQSDIGDFKGAVELGQKYAASSQAQQCFAQQWYRFAFGRSPSVERFPSVQALATGVAATGGDYKSLLRRLVVLDEFVYRPKGSL
ncbi:MAG: DUF1592 domain-containing protein [Polyangiaceae bacterium]|nr:DUF1592 domain-containing protein [Polyangiaceae bacterium]